MREEGYENHNVVLRRGRDGQFAFLYSAFLFGAAVYLLAHAFFKGLWADVLPVSAVSFFF